MDVTGEAILRHRIRLEISPEWKAKMPRAVGGPTYDHDKLADWLRDLAYWLKPHMIPTPPEGYALARWEISPETIFVIFEKTR